MGKRWLNMFRFRGNTAKIGGIIATAIGIVILVKVLPISVWLFLLGVVLVGVGFLLFTQN